MTFWYQEPDPRDDLNGLDVARKVRKAAGGLMAHLLTDSTQWSQVTILSRIAGLDMSLETLDIENIVPEPLRAVSSSAEFMKRLPEFDAHYKMLNDDAKGSGQVLRYVGAIHCGGVPTAKVKLQR
jgi:homoserine dehydrogenase